MRTRTITLVVGAAACAGAAALLTRSWLAAQVPRPAVQVVEHRTTEKPELRTVMVAARALPFGTKLTAAELQERQWPAASVPEGTFSSAAALTDASERVVLSAIAKDEPILASKVTGPGQRASLSVVIEQDKKAVTIRVDDVVGVGGFVQPDDRIDIMLTRTLRGVGDDREGSAYTDLLLQDIRVLAIDQLADRKAQAKPAKTVTVEVSTQEAQKLTLAASIGQLSLALRRAGVSQVAEPQRIGIEDLLKSKDTGGDKPVVTVTRATDRKQYHVQTGTVDESFAEQESAPPVTETVEMAPAQTGNSNTTGRRYVLPFGAPFGTARAEIDAPGIVSPVPQGPR